MSAIDIFKERLAAHLQRVIAPRYLGTRLQRCLDGKLRASVDLKCLECCNGYMKEVRFCSCIECPLWLVRPYRNEEGDALLLHELETETLGRTAVTDPENAS